MAALTPAMPGMTSAALSHGRGCSRDLAQRQELSLQSRAREANSGSFVGTRQTVADYPLTATLPAALSLASRNACNISLAPGTSGV